MDPRTQSATRSEWRALGFYYDRDDIARTWSIIGSRAGLHALVKLLRAYVVDPRNAMQSEHKHYGPYMYLKVITWPDAGIDRGSIRGPLPELSRLASLIERKAASLQPHESAAIGDEFATDSEYSLRLELREDSFDPASADADLTAAG